MHQRGEFLLLRKREVSGQGKPHALTVRLLSCCHSSEMGERWGRRGSGVTRLKKTGPGSVNQPQQAS